MKNRQLFPHITTNTKVRFGQPVIQGTRTPVGLVVGKVAGGMTIEDVMHEYDLTKEQVLAALQYAARIISNEDVATS